MKERVLSKDEKEWIRRLRNILRNIPPTLVVRQSNIDSSLSFYDKKTLKEIPFIGQRIIGFHECDHEEQIKVIK